MVAGRCTASFLCGLCVSAVIPLRAEECHRRGPEHAEEDQREMTSLWFFVRVHSRSFAEPTLFFVPFASFVVPPPETSPQPTPAIKFTPMLTPIYSRQRHKRLLDLMEKRRYDAIVIGAPQHVYYFTAH